MNGNQQQVFNIERNASLVLKNITITNAKSDYGGAIENHETLTIIDSVLADNTANWFGGAIQSIGPLTIINSVLENNTAGYYGGAIESSKSLTITQSTLNNNNANDRGGAISNTGTLNITDSILQNNTAKKYGGAISHHNPLDYISILISNFTDNHAKEGGSIYSLGAVNLTSNLFANNTADNRETIDLNNYDNGIFDENVYESTDIALKNLNLSIKNKRTVFNKSEKIILNFNIDLKHPNYYDEDIRKDLMT